MGVIIDPHLVEVDGFKFIRVCPSEEELKKCKSIPYYGTYKRPTDDGKVIRCYTDAEMLRFEVKEQEIIIYIQSFLLFTLGFANVLRFLLSLIY